MAGSTVVEGDRQGAMSIEYSSHNCGKVDPVKQTGEFEITMVPTEVGERVQVVSYGGEIPAYLVGWEAEVVGFTPRAGHPVLRFDKNASYTSVGDRVDRYGWGKVIDAKGKLVRPEGSIYP